MVDVRNVISLFNGMECGRIALDKASIKYDNYYASEIDQYANQVAKALYPDTIHLGDVRNIDTSKINNVDMLIGGSPCQGFSFSGKRKGMSTVDNINITTLEQYLELKENDFEFIGQSYLFWEYIRILRDLKPKYFFLENVIMDKTNEDILSKAVGYYPYKYNSSIISAQSRNRLYWTNIPNIKKPKDRGIVLKDIIEDEFIGVDLVRDCGKKLVKSDIEKGSCLLSRDYKGFGNQEQTGVRCGAFRGRDPKNPTSRKHCEKTEQMLETRTDQKTNTLTTVQKDNLIVYDIKDEHNPKFLKNYVQYDLSGKEHDSQDQRAYYKDGKHGTLTSNNGESKVKVYNDNRTWRKLTPRECGRLQTVPEDLLDIMLSCGVSNSRLYQIFGNGWTVDMIEHFFKNVKGSPEPSKSNYDFQIEENLW